MGIAQQLHAAQHAAHHWGDHASKFGADLTQRQFALLVLALVLGTSLEWYDFFSYSQLNAYITRLFFPQGDAALSQLSFWGVYAMGYVARPVGSIIFGHIGDARGRRVTLLLSLVMMAVPTVIIGCLPTYQHIGQAAPILMVVLRVIQGLAMGGEFGSALVYLHEIAKPSARSRTGAFGFAAAIGGCLSAVVVVVILEAALTEAQMLQFGWRIPFLLVIVSASFAFLLRMHMPEPTCWIADRERVIAANMRRRSLLRVATSSGGGGGAAGAAGTGTGAAASPRSPQHSLARSLSATLRQGSARRDGESGYGVGQPRDGDDFGGDVPSGVDLAGGNGGGGSDHHDQPAANANKSPPSPVSPPPAPSPVLSSPRSSANGGQNHHRAAVPRSEGGYLPLARLVTTSWLSLLLQFFFEAWISVGFYLCAAWLPVTLPKKWGVPMLQSQMMLMTNLAVMIAAMLLAGRASDRGMPRMLSSLVVHVAAVAVSIPVFIGVGRGHQVAATWVLHAFYMFILGWVLGVVPASMTSLYPPTARATGFNLGHNCAMSWLGGLSPTVMTALQAAFTSEHAAFLAPGILLTCAAALSALASGALLLYAPAANRSPAALAAAQAQQAAAQQAKGGGGVNGGGAAAADGGKAGAVVAAEV